MSDYAGSVGAHGLRYRFNFLAGQPIFEYDYDTDESEVVGYYVAEPKWLESKLSQEQLAEIDAEAKRSHEAYPDWSIDHHRWSVMEWDGVEHTHRRGKPIDDRRPARGWYCTMCDGAVVVEDPGDFPFVGGPADGKWIVTGGVQRFRVPVMEPLSAGMSWSASGDLLSDALGVTSAPTMRAAYYRRDGRRYVYEATR